MLYICTFLCIISNLVTFNIMRVFSFYGYYWLKKGNVDGAIIILKINLCIYKKKIPFKEVV